MKTPKPGMIPVRFKREWTFYRAGEIAGFDAARASVLVKQLKVAEYLEAPKAVEEIKHTAVVLDETPLPARPEVVTAEDVAKNTATPDSQVKKPSRWTKR